MAELDAANGYGLRKRRKMAEPSEGGEANLERLLDLAGSSSKIVVFSGSGLSASSGMSTFSTRGGLYERAQKKYRLNDGKMLFTYAFFDRQRPEAQAFFADIYSEAVRAEPAQGHHALRDLHLAGRLHRHYTMNIDGLAEEVGMDTWHHERNTGGVTVEMHGNVRLLVCPECHATLPMTAALAKQIRGKQAVPCSARGCGHGALRFKVMMYDDGESECITPDDVMGVMEADVKGADLVLWVGISFQQSASTLYFRKVRCWIQEAGRLDCTVQALINPSDEALFNLRTALSNQSELKVLEVLAESDEVLPLLADRLRGGAVPTAAAAAAAAARRQLEQQQQRRRRRSPQEQGRWSPPPRDEQQQQQRQIKQEDRQGRGLEAQRQQSKEDVEQQAAGAAAAAWALPPAAPNGVSAAVQGGGQAAATTALTQQQQQQQRHLLQQWVQHAEATLLGAQQREQQREQQQQVLPLQPLPLPLPQPWQKQVPGLSAAHAVLLQAIGLNTPAGGWQQQQQQATVHHQQQQQQQQPPALHMLQQTLAKMIHLTSSAQAAAAAQGGWQPQPIQQQQQQLLAPALLPQLQALAQAFGLPADFLQPAAAAPAIAGLTAAAAEGFQPLPLPLLSQQLLPGVPHMTAAPAAAAVVGGSLGAASQQATWPKGVVSLLPEQASHDSEQDRLSVAAVPPAVPRSAAPATDAAPGPIR